MSTFVAVLKKDALPLGKGRCVDIKGKRIAVFHTGAGYLAIDDGCTHADASLADGGLVDDCTIECPWHGAQFDLKTGAAKTLPAVEPVKQYKVRVTGDDIEVEVD
ncbi:MAG: non-heme iron oxygenase ferredoxin subunit [Planctomycetes bacterium]|nr:non-heme iron oxygenase ferredoxin subunit [Planctomycetota bacterium]